MSVAPLRRSRRLQPASAAGISLIPDADKVAPTDVVPMAPRLWAAVIDQALYTTVFFGTLLSGVPSRQLLLGAVGAATAVLLVQLMSEAISGATVGGAVTGIRTVGATTRWPAGLVAVARRTGILALAGTLLPFAGTWLVAVSGTWESSPSRRGWHDRAAGTVVLQATAVPNRHRRLELQEQARRQRRERKLVEQDLAALTRPHTPLPQIPPLPPTAPTPHRHMRSDRERLELSRLCDTDEVVDVQVPAPVQPEAARPVPVQPALVQPAPSQSASVQPALSQSAPVQPVVPSPRVPVWAQPPALAEPRVPVWARRTPELVGASVSHSAVAPVEARPARLGGYLSVSGDWAPPSAPVPVEPVPEPAVNPAVAPVLMPQPPVDNPWSGPTSTGGGNRQYLDESELTCLIDQGEQTVVTAGLRLLFDNGQTVEVRGDGVVGRDLSVFHEAVLHPVQVDDTTRSVSRVHLRFGPQDTRSLWVTDERSTNGTVLVNPEGRAMVLISGVRAVVGPGWRICFGERSAQVESRY